MCKVCNKCLRQITKGKLDKIYITKFVQWAMQWIPKEWGA
jgi:hypothetical protein